MRNRKLGLLPAFVLMALLSGCAGEDSNGRYSVPPMVEYSSAFQSQAAEELDALSPACPLHAPDPNCSTLVRLVEDYGELRARLRAE